ncbi:hypothetical protein JXC34_04855, partial [Candidatus Woesearchaeota archaeon]|nr:hypothetical protein [Candidatus Woesearchaeota archaeon]
FPNNIEYFNLSSRELNIGYLTAESTVHEVVVLSQVNLTGNISLLQGIHYIKIESTGDEVLISE